MNHETLYLAVKLVDLFLGKYLVKRDKLQLVGTTALYIAAKYDVSNHVNIILCTCWSKNLIFNLILFRRGVPL